MNKDNLGIGWKFPVRVDSKTGKVLMSRNEEDVHEAIKIILGSTKGVRALNPGFGSDVHKFAFGLTDSATLTLIKDCILEAIEEWEPRVGNVEVEAFCDKDVYNKVIITVSYEILQTSNTYSLTYPFYMDGES